MAIFQFFKMAAVRHLGFSKVGNTSGRIRRPNMRQHAKFREDRSYRSGDMADFSIFQDGGRPPSWICFTRVGTTHIEYLHTLGRKHVV